MRTHEGDDLYLTHAAFLRRLAESLRLDPDLAEDALQETWLASRLHPPRHHLNVRGWLATLLRNAARRLIRGDRRRAHRETLIARRNQGACNDARVGHEGKLGAVEFALNGLRQPYRETLLLRFYENLPPREIARCQGVPVETVRTRVRRGLLELRGRLESAPRRSWNANALVLLLLGRPIRCAAALALFGSITTSMLALGDSPRSLPRSDATHHIATATAPAQQRTAQAPETVAPGSASLAGSLRLGGQVLDDSGRSLSGVAVACFSLGWDAPAVLPSETVRSAEDGTFALHAAHRGEHLLVALAPACEPVWVVATPGELHALVCVIGLGVEGRTARGNAGSTVVIDSLQIGARLLLDGEELLWNRCRVERSSLRSRTEPSGHFAFFGLSAGPHRLHCPPLPDRIVYPPLRGMEWRTR